MNQHRARDLSTTAAPEGRASPDAASAACSLLRYAPAFVLLAAVAADSVQYADTDLWGHVRFGQIMLATGHLIRNDVFSYSAPGQPWINHEWLSEVVMALFYNAMGVVGLKLMKFLCASAIMALLATDMAETGAKPELQLGVLATAAFGLQLQIQFRPQLFDYIFLSALLALFARARNRGRAPLWIALPMMVLWANLHGGFFIGIVVLGVYAGVTGALDLWKGRGMSRGLSLGLLTLAALLVTLINPYGIGEWYIVIHNFQNPLTMHYNPEFQGMFHTVAGLYRSGDVTYPFMFALGTMAALLISCALAPSGDDLPQLAIAALMICAAFYSVRNMAFAVIACAAPLARHLELAIAGRRRARGALFPDQTAPPRASRRLQAIALVGAVVCSLQAGEFSPRLPDFTSYPVGAIHFMQRRGLYGNVLCDYIWAVYFIWHEAPRSRVFIDSFELRFPQAVQSDYLDFLRGGAGASAVLARYPTDYVLISPDSAPSRFMAGQAGWRLIYRDPVAMLFARADSPAAHIAGVPVLRDHAPLSLFP